MKIWYDTEFLERGPDYPIKLLSIGMVAEDGRTLYCVVNDAALWETVYALDDPWLRKNVIPALDAHPKPTSNKHEITTLPVIRQDILDFVGDERPEWWGYYADYDHVCLSQIFGKMINLPQGWPQLTMDIKQTALELENPRLPRQTTVPHNALNDALWTRDCYDYLMKIKAGQEALRNTIAHEERTLLRMRRDPVTGERLAPEWPG